MNIGVWGDSIVYGGGDENAYGWVGLLRKHYYNNDFTVYDRGVCGDTTQGLLKRFETESDSINPDIIIIAIGINDSELLHNADDTKVPLTSFKKNVLALLTIARQRAEKIILVGLTDLNFEIQEIDSWFSDETIENFDTCLSDIGKEFNLTFISMKNVLDVKNDLLDGIHPNTNGCKKMFDMILPEVQKKLNI